MGIIPNSLQFPLIGGISNDRQVVVMRNEKSPDFHTLSWRSINVDVIAISRRDKKWFMNKSMKL